MEKENIKLLMVNSANLVLEIKRRNATFLPDQIIKRFIETLEKEENPDKNVLAIAAANEALELKESNKKLTDKQIVQRVMDKSDFIIKKAEGEN